MLTEKQTKMIEKRKRPTLFAEERKHKKATPVER